MNERLRMSDRQQMEIGFTRGCSFQPTVRRQRRLSRARWWFNQMRQVVNDALQRQPAPAPRPEQIYLSLGQVPNRWR